MFSKLVNKLKNKNKYKVCCGGGEINVVVEYCGYVHNHIVKGGEDPTLYEIIRLFRNVIDDSIVDYRILDGKYDKTVKIRSFASPNVTIHLDITDYSLVRGVNVNFQDATVKLPYNGLYYDPIFNDAKLNELLGFYLDADIEYETTRISGGGSLFINEEEFFLDDVFVEIPNLRSDVLRLIDYACNRHRYCYINTNWEKLLQYQGFCEGWSSNFDFEGFILGLYQLAHSRTKTQVFSTSLLLVKLYTGKRIMKHMEEILLNFAQCIIFTQSDNPIDQALDIISDYDAFKKSDFFKNAYTLASVMIAKFSGDLEYSDEFMITLRDEGTKIINGSPDFGVFVTRSVLLLFKRVQQAIVHKSAKLLCYDDFTVDEFVSDVKELENLVSHYNNLLPFKTTPEEVRLRLEAAIQRASEIKVMVKGKLAAKKFITDLTTRLMVLQNKIKAIDHCSQERPLPFAVLFTGSPGIGKSNLVNLTGKVFCSSIGVKPKREWFHFAIKDSDFDDGFKSYKFIWVADDIGQDDPKRVQGVDKEVTRLINIINSVPLMANMPDVDSKGMVPIVPKLVIGTSNIPDIHAQIYCSKPYAALRRFNMNIQVKVKPRFADSQGRLNQHKVNLHTGMPDWWDFKIVKPVRVSTVERSCKERVDLIPIDDIPEMGIYGGRIDSVELLIKYMMRCLQEHNENQGNQDEFMDFLDKVKICQECGTWLCEHADPDGKYKDLQAKNDLTPERKILEEGFPIISPIEEIGDTELQSDIQPIPGRRRWPILWCTFLTILSSFIQIGDATVVALGMHVYTVELLIVVTLICNWWLIILIWPALFYIIIAPFRDSINRALEASFNLMVQNLRQEVRNWFIQRIAERAGKFLSPMAVGLCTAIIFMQYHTLHRILKGVIHMFNYITIRQETNGTVEAFKDVSKNRQWEKSDHKICKKMFPDKGWSLGQRNRAEVVKYFENNVARIYFETDSSPVVTNIFSLGGQTWIINKHTFDLQKMGGCVNYTIQYMTGGVKHTCVGELDLRTVAIINDVDACVFTIPGISPRKKISDILTNDDGKIGRVPIDGLYIGRDDDGNTTCNPVKKIIIDNPPSKGHAHKYWRGCPEKATVKGDCGSLLVYHDQVVAIVGFHTLGNLTGNFSWATPISPSICQRISSTQLTIGKPQISKNDNLIQELNDKNVTNWIENCNDLDLFGNLDTYVANAKSTTGPTVMCTYMNNAGISTDKIAPSLSGPGRYMPFNIFASHLAANFCRIPKSFMDLAVLNYTSQLLKGDLSGIRMLTWEEAINGIPGCRYIDAMMKSTSGGYNFPGLKLDHMVCNDGVWSLKDHVMDEINRAWSCYANCKTFGFLFKTAIKDEPVSVAKNESFNLRVFNVCPMSFVVISRRIFMTFIKFFQENRHLSESAVGINAHGVEWQNLLKHLLFDEEPTDEGINNLQIMAGDFKKFDLSMHTETLQAVSTVIMSVLSSAGWNPQDLTIAYACLNELIFKYIVIRGEVVFAKNSNPSGNSLTVIINCIANSLYHRAVYYKLLTDNGETFMPDFGKIHRLVTYGDDSILSSADGDKILNHISMHETLAKWNIGYTMADKSDNFVEFIPLNKATFLKRSFVYHEEIKRYVAPLDIASVNKMLCICTYTKCGWTAQVEGTIRSAFYELVFHGRDIYEKYRTIIMGFLNQDPYTWTHPIYKNEIEIELSQIWRPPPYDDMVLQWYENNGSDLQLLGEQPNQL